MRETIAKVHKVCELIEGHSATGNWWSKQRVVFATDNGKMLAVEYFGDRKTALTKGLHPGDVCGITYTIESEEYNGKWYTRISGIGLTVYQKTLVSKEPQTPPPPEAAPDDEPPS